MTQAQILGECPELLKLPLLHRPPRRHAILHISFLFFLLRPEFARSALQADGYITYTT